MTEPRPGPLCIALIGDPNSVHVRRWAAYFADRGHRLHILTPDTDPITAPVDPRFEVHTFRAWRRSRIRGRSMVETSRSLTRALAAIRPDVLHSHSVGRYGLAAWLSRFRPYAVTVWGTDVLITPGLSRRQRIQTWLALHGAALVTGGSDHLVKAAIAAGARPDRTQYLHFGVDTDRFSPGDAPAEMRQRLGLGNARIVLSPRGIAPVYRQGVVVEAFAALPPDTLLLMTRQSVREEELAAIMAKAELLGVADRLRIVPGVAESEVPDLYRLADVVVSVPASDGGPNTVVESLACGRPIVASDLAPNREWLADLDPAALVAVGDAAATAAAIAAILNRPAAERAERAARGRAAVCDRADRVVSMARMEALYRDLASRRKGTR